MTNVRLGIKERLKVQVLGRRSAWFVTYYKVGSRLRYMDTSREWLHFVL
jgi:hypothetical protein